MKGLLWSDGVHESGISEKPGTLGNYDSTIKSTRELVGGAQKRKEWVQFQIPSRYR